MNDQRGLSIIELLVSIVIGLTIIVGATMTFVPIAISTRESVTSSKMNTDARAITDLIANELRRAGYKNSSNKIRVIDSSCIIYPYANESPITVEYHGIRLSNKAVYISQNLLATTTSCATAGTWQPLSDSATIEVTKLNFTCTPPRNIRIVFEAKTKDDHRLNEYELTVAPRNANCE